MANVDYQNSILWRGEDPTKKKFKPQYDGSTKVARYFPGKKPKWAGEGDGEGDEAAASGAASLQRQRPRPTRAQAAVLEDAAAGRLRRLQTSAPSGSEGRAERLLRHRVIHDAQVLEEEKDEEKKEIKGENEDLGGGFATVLATAELSGADSDADVEPKLEDPDLAEQEEIRAFQRERARELALLKRKEEEEVMKEELEEEASEDDLGEDEDSEESDSDDDPRRGALLKPIFVSKSQRETVREKEAIEREEEAAKEKAKTRVKERKVESKTMLVEEIRRTEEAEREGLNDNDASDIELIDDDDEKNEAEEYELWKIRELKRIKRDKEERLTRQKELEWIEKRRGMTDAEREADDKRLEAEAHHREESKSFGFMQKYYHRGGFFQDKARTGEEPLYLRDYHEPLAEEKHDKNLLPKVMQLRRGQFGKKGQVKHSHLTQVDTTDKSAAWAQQDKQVQKYQEKMAAAKGVDKFDRPGRATYATRNTDD
mmetsp:Transcript_4486/g.10424  ORF Transcript_4486/g.10424 Transcript_4486/m.10424 type:complete len:485 (-) Transcript_4486:59-1513(-)